MAEGDGFHPFKRNDRPKYNRQLSDGDVGNQARQLLLSFIQERLNNDGITEVRQDMLQDPSTPSGPPIEHVTEVAMALRKIGDELDGDAHLQKLIQKIPPDAPQQTFMAVAKEIFADGNLNWGRIVMLFYFAYKIIVKALRAVVDQIPLARNVIEWVVGYIRDNVAHWIISRGGWESVLEHFGSSASQTLTVLCTGVIVSALLVLYKSWK